MLSVYYDQIFENEFFSSMSKSSVVRVFIPHNGVY